MNIVPLNLTTIIMGVQRVKRMNIVALNLTTMIMGVQRIKRKRE
jgi:hypothetical protein